MATRAGRVPVLEGKVEIRVAGLRDVDTVF
jgi:hypothetical protein